MGKSKAPAVAPIVITAGKENKGPVKVHCGSAPPGPGWYSVPLMKINESKVKAPFMRPALPVEFIEQVGLIALTWADYENVFDEWLAGLINKARLKLEIEEWFRSSYRIRRKLFRDAATNALANNPYLLKYLLSVLDDSAALHRDRNFVVHGRLGGHATFNNKKPPTFRLLCLAVERKHVVQRLFTVDALEDIAYETMHLSGRLKTFSRPNVEAPTLSVDDKSVAQKVLDKGYKILSKASKR